jgi:uncharacterized protein YdeI (YjbR/CyaY-like superfamily)
MDVKFFASPAELRAWFEENHDRAQELWVGFHKKATGRPSITWPEAVDQALCFGWIDGIRKRVDDASYTNRFTPRRPGSTWSAVNVKRVGELSALGLMRPAGLAAFNRRDEARTNLYSFEQASVALDAAYEQTFRANGPAWDYFQSQPPSYRRTAIWWVMSAKKEETRLRRLATLIDDSEQGRRLAHLSRPPKPDLPSSR